jgi:hypothetical protein
MSNRSSRSGWMMIISSLVLAVWVGGVAAIGWRGLGRIRGKISDRFARVFTGRAQERAAAEGMPVGPMHLNDHRLDSLRLAADSWKGSTGPRRQVVDQVCLVPDVDSFLEAIALWDEQSFFPILIDEPAWTLPFLRAYRPARVVRFSVRARLAGPAAPAVSGSPPAASDHIWPQALEAVARAWSGQAQPNGTLPAADRPPRQLGATPPGLVLADPQAPMFAGAVALAAGRFQPLVRLDAPGNFIASPGNSLPIGHFHDVLSLAEAVQFARSVEIRVAGVVPDYQRLGDDCDFLTIAGDWPYHYSFDQADQTVRGLYALDDLIGRVFDVTARNGWMNQTRRRWAFTGRLLGDPAASVARAMAALFLQPDSALLWNTYGGGSPWTDYSMERAAAELSPSFHKAGAVVHHFGRQADLASWHRSVAPINRNGMVLFNSTGGPDWFSISGGPGRPSDIPRGLPASVAIVHSFSAADPTDPQTIAGRWLANGAFAYFGSVYEPYLLAFRSPGLVAELLAAEIPLVAALRQGELEAFGFPWRLIYLGDPLYRLQKRDAVEARSTVRITPDEWRKLAPDYDNWPVAEVTARRALASRPPQATEPAPEDDRLQWCLDASIEELAARPSKPVAKKTGYRHRDPSPKSFPADGWRKVLMAIHRGKLDQGLRPVFDELLIDTLEEVDALEELMDRLAQIPPAERGPRVWQAIETGAMQRLARSMDERDPAAGFVRALDLWDEVIRSNWPQNSRFPAHFSERIGTFALADSRRLRPWFDRIRQAGEVMGSDLSRNPHISVIKAEQARAKAQLGGLGSSR